MKECMAKKIEGADCTLVNFNCQNFVIGDDASRILVEFQSHLEFNLIGIFQIIEQSCDNIFFSHFFQLVCTQNK